MQRDHAVTARVLRLTAFSMLAGLLLVAALGGAALVLTTQGQSIIERIVERREAGELEQSVRLAARRIFERLRVGGGVSARSVEAPRDDMPQTKVIPAIPTAERTPAVRSDGVEAFGWNHSFGGYGSQKHADISWLTPNKAKELQRIWTYETPDAAANIQATPVFTGRLLVFPDARDRIVALSPKTGKQVWEFDPGIRQPARRGLIFVADKGGKAGAGHIYFAAVGRVFALDAATGTPDQDFGDGGSVRVGYSVRVAPRVHGDTLYLASFMPGLHAIDRHSGERLWTTDLLSGEVTKSLIGRWSVARRGFEGANPWGGMTLDPSRGLLFLSLGNPTPVAYGANRSGKNAPANSVIAIDAATGELRWQFQEIMHDLWDLDIASPPVLVQIERDGRLWDEVAVPTKAGNLLLLDRSSGRPVFDWRLRRAPTSSVPGERTAAYQPDPVLPEPFGKMAFTEEDLSDIGETNREVVQRKIQNANYGFFVPHEADRKTVFFGLHGGAMQMGAAFDPQDGVLFVAASHVPSAFTITNGGERGSAPVRRLTGTGANIYAKRCAACHGERLEGATGPSLAALDPAYDRGRFFTILNEGLRTMPAVNDLDSEKADALYRLLVLGDGVVRATPESDPDMAEDSALGSYERTAYHKLKDHEGYPGSKPPWGTLTAIDLASGQHRWRVPLGRHDELIERGIAQTGTENMSGPVVTAGGVVFVSGTKDRLIRAFNARTGQGVWEAHLPFIGSASPIVFEYDGAGYVVVPATGGGTLALYDSSVETGSAFVAFRVGR